MNLDYKLDRGLRAFAKAVNVFDRAMPLRALRQNFFLAGSLAAPGRPGQRDFYAPAPLRAPSGLGYSSCRRAERR